MYDEETEELSAEYENLSGVIADLTKTAKTPGGISLFTDSSKTEYKSTYEILREISEIWNDITDKQQAQLLEKLFAKTRANQGAAILSNFSAAEKAIKEMSNAAGSADREMENVEQSLEFKINKLGATWTGFAQDIFDRGDLGGAIELLTKLSEVVTGLLSKIMEFGNLKDPFAFLGGVTGIATTLSGHGKRISFLSIVICPLYKDYL